MDSKHQLAKQYKGFLDTPSIFQETENFELFSFSGKNKEGSKELKLKPIPENLVLGKRVELFFRECIENSKTHTILAANLQIIESKITLGELDFLLKDIVNDEFLHVELVYKFYIYDPSVEGELQRWIGPNRRDSLSYKIKKLRDKQLPLLQNKITQDYLRELNLSYQEMKQQVCFLGKLYVPIHLFGNHFPEINNECIVGFWLTLDTFIERHQNNDGYCLPKKENWLVHPKNNEAWISFEDAIKHIEHSLQNNKSLLCWKKKSANKYEQFFIIWWE